MTTQDTDGHISERLVAVRRNLAEVNRLRECTPGTLDVDIQSLTVYRPDGASRKKFDLAKNGKTVRDCLRKALRASLSDLLWYHKIQLENEEAALMNKLASLLNPDAPKVE